MGDFGSIFNKNRDYINIIKNNESTCASIYLRIDGNYYQVHDLPIELYDMVHSSGSYDSIVSILNEIVSNNQEE